jgi:enamine deaminase RidA (YjgF/YER057c/UK114 family)
MTRKRFKKQKTVIKQLEKKANKLGKKQCSVAEQLDAATAKARQRLDKIDTRREKVLQKIAVLTGVTETEMNHREQVTIDKRLFANAPWEDLPLGLLFGKNK